MRYRAGATLFMLGLVLFIVVAPVVVRAEPTITLREQTGRQPGVRIEGSGLTPGTTYRIVTRDPTGRESGIDSTAGTAGTVVEVFGFSGGDPDGTYTVEIRDKASGAVLASATFERRGNQLSFPATPQLPPNTGSGETKSTSLLLLGLFVAGLLVTTTGFLLRRRAV